MHTYMIKVCTDFLKPGWKRYFMEQQQKRGNLILRSVRDICFEQLAFPSMLSRYMQQVGPQEGGEGADRAIATPYILAGQLTLLPGEHHSTPSPLPRISNLPTILVGQYYELASAICAQLSSLHEVANGHSVQDQICFTKVITE